MDNIFKTMIMQSHEDADKLIKELKEQININKNFIQEDYVLKYNDSHLLELDKQRVRSTIEKFLSNIL